MKLNFENKIAIVTGGTKGIGKSISEGLLNLNCTVHITGRGERPIWCDQYKRCHFYRVDFTKETELNTFISAIEALNQVDILINNAGILVMHDITDIKLSDWKKVLDVNLTAPMLISKTVASLMKKTMKKGKILNISSTAGIISKPKQNSYSATKSGLIGLTRASALDLASYGIIVNTLCPGTTETKMVEMLNSNQKKTILKSIPLGRFASVQEISNFALFLCSDYNTYLTGQAIIVDGGFTTK